jgi:hypothetical protein
MSEFGHRQPQSVMMAGPDGVVYDVTSAGAVPSAHAAAPARQETTRGQEALHGQQRAPGVVTWCFSYSADRTADQPRALPTTTSCFSCSADGTPIQSRPGDAGPCFSYSPAPPRSTDRDASEATGSLPAMPVWACFSYGLPPGDRSAARRGMPWVRQMPVVSPCFSYSANLPPGRSAMPGEVTPCFSYSADPPPGPSELPGEVTACFSYTDELPMMPGQGSPCFSY